MLQLGDLEGAYRLLESPAGRELDDETHGAVEQALFYARQLERALRVSELRFSRFRSAPAAYNAACSEARLGHPEAAIQWLRAAIEAGFADLEQMSKDEDLAALHGHSGFEALIAPRSAVRSTP